MLRLLILASVILSLMPAPATAQALGTQRLPVPCDAFRRSPDGRWWVARQVTITGPNRTSATLGRGTWIGGGVIVSDLPLAVVLERQCYRWRVSELLQIRL